MNEEREGKTILGIIQPRMSHLGSVLELSDLPEKPTIMEISQLFYQTTSWEAPELITQPSSSAFSNILLSVKGTHYSVDGG